jgi:hypothetical protein
MRVRVLFLTDDPAGQLELKRAVLCLFKPVRLPFRLSEKLLNFRLGSKFHVARGKIRVLCERSLSSSPSQFTAMARARDRERGCIIAAEQSYSLKRPGPTNDSREGIRMSPPLAYPLRR